MASFGPRYENRLNADEIGREATYEQVTARYKGRQKHIRLSSMTGIEVADANIIRVREKGGE